MGSGFDSLMAHHITPARIIRRGGFAILEPLKRDARSERNCDERGAARGTLARFNAGDSRAPHARRLTELILREAYRLTHAAKSIRKLKFWYPALRIYRSSHIANNARDLVNESNDSR